MDTRWSLIFSLASVCLAPVSVGQKYYHVRERPVPSGLPSTVTVRAWRGGLVGRIRVFIEDDVTDGWEMILHFPRKVLSLEVSGAKITSIGSFQKHYRLENKDYNAVLDAGTKLKLLFVARTFKFVSGLEGKIEFLPKVEDAGSMANEPGESSGGNMTENVDGESAGGNATVTEGDGECSLTCEAQVVIISQWPSNFEGRVTFQLDSAVQNGWTATLFFPQNIVTELQIWNADITDSYRDGPGTVFKIKNKSWNANISGSFEFNFIATIVEAIGYQFYAHMDGQPRCACSIED